MAKSCKGCYYHRPLCASANRGLKVCHYLLMTDKRRGCEPSECDKKLILTKAQAKKKDKEYRLKILKESIYGRYDF